MLTRQKRLKSVLLIILSGVSFHASAMAEELPPLTPIPLPSERSEKPNKISMYYKDTSAKDAFNLLSKASGKNIIVNNDLKGNVNLKLQDVSFDNALNSLCLVLGITYEEVGDVYVVSQPTTNRPTPFLPNNLIAAKSSSDPGKRLVSINIKNSDLPNVIETLANQAGVEIIIFGHANGQVTARLQSIPFEEALKTILIGSKLSYAREGDRFLIGDPVMTDGLVQQNLESELIKLNNISPKELMEILPPNIDTSRIKVLDGKNALVVTGPKTLIGKVNEYAKTVDVPKPQVALEINIIEISKNVSDQLTFLKPNLQVEFVKKIDKIQLGIINDTISSLIKVGKATIKAQPSISTISGQKAKIDISEDINFELTTAIGTGVGTAITSNLKTISAGTVMEVTPSVGKDGLINMNLDVEVSGVSSFTTASNGALIPNVRRRRASTQVNVLDNETIMIAGLTKNEDRKNHQKFPGISRIPFESVLQLGV